MARKFSNVPDFLQLIGLSAWICLIVQTGYGLGKHGLFIPIADRIKFEEITFWKTVFSDGVAMGLLRISMAISLLRLKRDLKWYKWSLYAVMGKRILYSLDLHFVAAAHSILSSLCGAVLYPGHCLVVRVLHSFLGMVGVPVDEPL